MAEALGVSSQGSQKELEERLARKILDNTLDRVLVVEIVHAITPESKAEAEAVFTLVAELWTSLVQRARQWRSAVPAFLLVPIAYSKRRCWYGRRRAAAQTRKVLERLADEPEREGCLIEVLPELTPFEQKQVEYFLTRACNKSRADARRLASQIIRAGDNEAILERMEQMMTRWAQS